MFNNASLQETLHSTLRRLAHPRPATMSLPAAATVLDGVTWRQFDRHAANRRMSATMHLLSRTVTGAGAKMRSA